jgi:uncharacterized protein with HEPN domain
MGDIRGMGNRLRHAYDGLDPDIIWKAATIDLPQLAAEVRTAPTRLRRERNGAR